MRLCVFSCARSAIFINNYKDIITFTASQTSELVLEQLTFLIQYFGSPVQIV